MVMSTTQSSVLIPCPVEGCEIFPFTSQADVDSHVAAGDHVWPVGQERVAEVRGESIDAPARGGEGAASGAAPSNGPTDAQVRFITKLAAEIGREVEIPKTKRAASALIDELQAAKKSQPMVRRNARAQKCEECGHMVEANAGHLYKNEATGRWLVCHEAGKCVEGPAPVEQTTTRSTYRDDVPAAHYAIPSTGDNDLVFYRVDRPTEGDYAGRVFVKMIIGGRPAQSVRYANIAGILDRIAEHGVEASAALYGQEIGRCCRCNRHLTDQVSRERGIGPECIKKGWS